MRNLIYILPLLLSGCVHDELFIVCTLSELIDFGFLGLFLVLVILITVVSWIRDAIKKLGGGE